MQLAVIAKLLDQNGVFYRIYGSLACRIYTGLDIPVADWDIMISNRDFVKIERIFARRKEFRINRSAYVIHVNYLPEIGPDGLPFDISFDSYEHFFARLPVSMNRASLAKIDGYEVKLLPLNELIAIYDFCSKLRGPKQAKYAERLALLRRVV